MNTKALRQKILDLAIHGKLVPQDPNDEPASMLLERIRAEKERLIKEGKIKKPKKAKATCDKPRYPFRLPEGWVWTTLGEITNYGDSNNVQVEDIANNSWILELEDIEKDSANIIQYQTKNDRNINGTRHKFQKGEILYSKLRTYLNKVLVAPNDGFCTTEIMAFGSYGILSNKYICHVLRSPYFLEYTLQCGYGVKMPRLSTTDACNGLIPLPPFAEQKRIVNEIQRLFSIIDIVEDGKDDLQVAIQMAKSKILDLAIHGKLVPQDPSDEPASELLKRTNPKAEITCDTPRYGKLPDTWVWTTLGEISNYGDNKSVAVENIDDNEWILELEDLEKDTANIIQKFKKKERIIKGVRHSFSKGNILYSKLRTYLNKVLIAPSDGFCTTEMIAFDANDQILNDYICYVLRSKFFVDYTKQCGYGVKMPRLSTTDARKGLIPLPPINEQHRIVAKIEELFAQLDKIESSL